MTRTHRAATPLLSGQVWSRAAAKGVQWVESWPHPKGGEPGLRVGARTSPSTWPISVCSPAGTARTLWFLLGGSGLQGFSATKLPLATGAVRSPQFPLGIGAVGRGEANGSPRPVLHGQHPPHVTCCHSQPPGIVLTDAGTGKDPTHGCSETDWPLGACQSCVCSTTEGPPKCQPRPPGTHLSYQHPQGHLVQPQARSSTW